MSASAIDARSTGAAEAVLLLGAAVACIYALDAAEVIQFLPGEAAVLFGIALVQGGWLVTARRGGPRSLIAGAVLNALLVGLWAASRTVGLPIGSVGRVPVGLLDSLCAVDSTVLALLALALASRGRPRVPSWSLAAAVALSLVSVCALHAPGTSVASSGSGLRFGGAEHHPYHFYCQLL
jgi:hypothetical protein